MTTIGTGFFTSRAAANRYWRDYGCTPKDVQTKLDEGLIKIGKPELEPGQTLSVIDNGTRYAITEA